MGERCFAFGRRWTHRASAAMLSGADDREDLQVSRRCEGMIYTVHRRSDSRTLGAVNSDGLLM